MREIASHSSWVFEDEVGIALGEEFLVLDPAEPLAGAGVFRVVHVDDDEIGAMGDADRLFHHLGILAIGDEHLGLAVVEDEGHRLGVEPDVDRVEHRAAAGYTEMALVHLGRVVEDHRHRVVLLHPELAQGGGEPLGALLDLFPGIAALAVDDGGEPLARVARDVLPDVQHRPAGGVHQRAAQALQPRQFVHRDPEGRDDDDVARPELG